MNDLIVEMEVLDSQVPRVFESLLREGYEYGGAKLDGTQALGAYVEALLHNPKLGRSIRVSYLPPLPPYPDALVVHVDNGTSDTFAVTNFLRHIGVPPSELRPLDLGQYSGGLVDRVSACLRALKAAVDKYLEPIVSGVEWKHVPIDWAGHK